MKLIHIADLHIGKRVNEFSMLEDQKYILIKILNIIDEHKPDGILIAGDVYDKSMPSADAVELFDEFLTAIAERSMSCFVISGNHDSPERIAYGSQIMKSRGIHMAKVFDGQMKPTVLKDETGEVNIYMMPFIKPANVRRFYPDAEIESFHDAINTVIQNTPIDPAGRNVLLAHQFVAGKGIQPERSESEAISVGGLDNIDVNIFDAFDYVALGHLHGPQSIKRDTVRYAGSPLKYSFSEVRHNKSVTLVELGEKGNITVKTIPLIPLRDMRVIRGPINELLSPSVYEGTDTEDYIQVILTDEEDILDSMGKIRTVYPNVMHLEYDNLRYQEMKSGTTVEDPAQKTHLELFREFYLLQNNIELDDEKMAIVSKILCELGGNPL